MHYVHGVNAYVTNGYDHDRGDRHYVIHDYDRAHDHGHGCGYGLMHGHDCVLDDVHVHGYISYHARVLFKFSFIFYDCVHDCIFLLAYAYVLCCYVRGHDGAKVRVHVSIPDVLHAQHPREVPSLCKDCNQVRKTKSKAYKMDPQQLIYL